MLHQKDTDDEVYTNGKQKIDKTEILDYSAMLLQEKEWKFIFKILRDSHIAYVSLLKLDVIIFL